MGLHGFTSNKAYLDRKVWKDHYKPVHILESYHYIQNGRILPSIKKNKDSIFLDSGAFSMFTQQIEVDLRAYAEFIQENKKLIHVASNLDVIGRGNEKGSYKNQKKLEKYGATISPVHHARDEDKWLERYIDEGYDYIFLGGMVPESTKYLEPWLDRIWDKYLTDKYGVPKVKVHGFGLTTDRLMLKYPWYSVDSTSWAIVAGMGSIVVPMVRKNKLHRMVTYSAQSPRVKKRDAHIFTLTEPEIDVINRFIKSWGFRKSDLRNSAAHRRMFNLLAFRHMQETADWPKTFTNKDRGLFY